MGKLAVSLLIGVTTATLLAGCGKGGARAGGGHQRLSVVASFYPMAEAATRAGGSRVKVTNLTPVGVEPHDIELTPRQVQELQDADLVIYVGQGFQPAVAKVASASPRSKGRVDVLDKISLEAGAAAAIKAEEGGRPGGGPSAAGELDPHFWLDPTLMARAVDEVTDGLARISPADASTFRANAEGYKAELSALDGELSRGLAECQRREFVTSHAAFFYLARRYGLTQIPITGLSPEAEPDPARLAQLAGEIKAKGITTVFFEELVSPKISQTLAREAGVKTAVLSPIEGLTRAELDAGKDYVAVMRDNLAALRAALGCR